MKKLAIILLLLLVVLTVCRGQSALESTPLRVSFLGCAYMEIPLSRIAKV